MLFLFTKGSSCPWLSCFTELTKYATCSGSHHNGLCFKLKPNQHRAPEKSNTAGSLTATSPVLTSRAQPEQHHAQTRSWFPFERESRWANCEGGTVCPDTSFERNTYKQSIMLHPLFKNGNTTVQTQDSRLLVASLATICTPRRTLKQSGCKFSSSMKCCARMQQPRHVYELCVLNVAQNEVKNASFAQPSAHRDSRIWRSELIEPAAEPKRRARGRRLTFKSAYPDPQILPQCNISSNYPYNVWFFWVSRHRSIILAKKIETFSGRFWEIPGNVLKLELLKMLINHKNALVFFQAVSGKSSWSFSYRWTQYQWEKNSY